MGRGALSTTIRFLSGIIGALSIFIYILHNAAPYLKLECVALSMNCPIAKSYGTINDGTYYDKKSDSMHLKPLKQIMQSWIRNGYSTGTQLSVFQHNKERLNIFARDDRILPRFDQNSLTPFFSTSKSFAAMLIGVAVQNKWIHSYDDEVNKYWPNFPTKRIIIPYEHWTRFVDECNAKNINCNETHFIKYCNANSIALRKNYKIKIRDVLRHEGGFSHVLNRRELSLKNVSYGDMKSLIESTEYLIFFKEANRNYHAFTRGYILNQIFMNVQPNKRSMAEYYQNEIFPKLSDKIEDNEFFVSFDGLGGYNESLLDRMYHIVQQPVYWTLYHVVLPILLGWDVPLSDVFGKQLCPSQVMDSRFCSNQTLKTSKHTMNAFKYTLLPNYIEWNDLLTDGPIAISKNFMGNLQMAHMSVSGVGSAHSIAKSASYMLFGGEVLNKDMVKEMTDESIKKFDAVLNEESNFSKGGFDHRMYHGVDWYGWGGWGGSVMMFSPKYECVVAFTVTAFNSPHYNGLQEPRINTIMNMVSMQLFDDDKDNNKNEK